MNRRQRGLKLLRRGGQLWLVREDGSEYCGATVGELLKNVRRAAGDQALGIGARDCVSIRISMLEAGPLLKALRPATPLVPRLEEAAECWTTAQPVFSFGNLVNGEKWGWFLSRERADSGWHLVPAQFAAEEPCVFYARYCFLDSMTSGCVSSTIMLRHSVAAETANGDNDNVFPSWSEIHYGVSNVEDLVLSHLTKEDTGLPSADYDAPCPACQPEPDGSYTYSVWVGRPVRKSLLGRALARISRPCATHKREGAAILFDGRTYVWHKSQWKLFR